MFKKLKSVNWQKSIGCYLFIYLLCRRTKEGFNLEGYWAKIK